MMALEITVIVLLINGIIYAGGLQCESCRGSACSDETVPFIDCDDQTNQLPYNFEISQSNTADPVHTCIDLEFTKGQRKVPVRQCLFLSTSNNLCSEITVSLPSSVKLEKCNVARNKRDANMETSTSSSDGTTVQLETTDAAMTTVPRAEPAPTNPPSAIITNILSTVPELESENPSTVSDALSTIVPSSSTAFKPTPAALSASSVETQSTALSTPKLIVKTIDEKMSTMGANELVPNKLPLSTNSPHVIVKTMDEKMSTIIANELVPNKLPLSTNSPHVIGITAGKPLTTLRPKGSSALPLISLFALSSSVLIQILL